MGVDYRKMERLWVCIIGRWRCGMFSCVLVGYRYEYCHLSATIYCSRMD